MIDYLQFHIKDVDTGNVRVVPEDPESYGSSQGADFFVQGPIIAFAGRLARYVSQIQPYLSREKDNVDFGLPQPGVAFDDRETSIPANLTTIDAMGFPAGKAIRGDNIKRIARISIYSGAWIEGFEITYELSSGGTATCTHGTTSGVSATTPLQGMEIDRSYAGSR